ILDGITSTRVDDDDRLRLPPIPPPQSSGTEKKESQDRLHNQACRPSGKRSSTSSHDLHPDNVLTVTYSLQISPSLKCQSSASGIQSAKALDEKWSRYLSLQELILVVPRTQDAQTSLAINWPCAAGIDVVSLDRRTPANEKKG